MTLEQFINDLQSMKPSLKKLPVKVVAANGIELDAIIKVGYKKPLDLNSKPEIIVITY